jgi:hypothetical protein
MPAEGQKLHQHARLHAFLRLYSADFRVSREWHPRVFRLMVRWSCTGPNRLAGPSGTVAAFFQVSRSQKWARAMKASKSVQVCSGMLTSRLLDPASGTN